mmetsp:Transcript_484/g.799  ORF Transcript_484/g.799 Transcript_484/m.799 type:complete len:366 (-) Transcript_484:160-1257(-)
MAMVQSDWSKLEQFWNSCDDDGDDWSPFVHSNPNDNTDSTNKKKSTPTSLFPSKLSLEELYGRIGSTTYTSTYTSLQPPPRTRQRRGPSPVHPSSSNLTATTTPTRIMMLQDLPAELHHNIATYLRAKSLYAFRCTHPILYHALLGTVPGLRNSLLRLYRHQRTSLHWMHQREQAVNTRIETSASFRTTTSCFAVHNSATAECWKMLSNRHGTKRYWYDALRGSISSMDDDNDCNNDHNNSNSNDNDGYYSVSVPRGGLLCDDPGLGKTITVLSLILQTWGKCHDNNDDNDDDDNDDSNTTTTTTSMDEAIFTAYWKETPAFSRRQELMKLTNQLRRVDGAQFFERAVYPTATATTTTIKQQQPE